MKAYLRLVVRCGFFFFPSVLQPQVFLFEQQLFPRFAARRNKTLIFERLAVETQQRRRLCGRVLILCHPMMWYARVERLGFVLRCFALGIEIRLCGDISVKTPATPGRRSVRLVLLIMMKEGMSCSRRCYSSYVLDTINNIWIKRSCPSWIFEAQPPPPPPPYVACSDGVSLFEGCLGSLLLMSEL